MSNEKTALKQRLKSWAVWLSVLGAVGIILNATGALEKLGLDQSGWDSVINAVGAVLVGFGILNNPTDREHF